MATIKMLKTAKGASEGHTIATYLEGEEYEVSETLAACFEEEKVAERIEQKAEKAPKNKAEKAPKNKAQ